MKKLKPWTIAVVVVVLILLLLGFLRATITFTHHPPGLRDKVQIISFMHAVRLFHKLHGKYPSAEEGLAALVEDKLLTEDYVPRGSWGNEYVYRYPGKDGPGSFDIISYGADGKPGGTGQNADITNGDLDE